MKLTLTFFEKDPVIGYNKHCRVTVPPAAVIVDINKELNGEVCTISAIDFQGEMTSVILPRETKLFSVDLPFGTWDRLAKVGHIDGQLYKFSGDTFTADEGIAFLWNFALTSREIRERAVLRVPMFNPILVDPVGPTLSAPVAPAALPAAPVAKPVPAVQPVPPAVAAPVSREAQLAAAKAAQLAALSKRRGFGRR